MMDKEALNRALASAAKSNEIHVHLSNCKPKERATWLVELAKVLIADKEAVGAIRNRRKIVSSTDGLTAKQIKVIKGVKPDEVKGVFVLGLENKNEIVLFSSRMLDEKVQKLLIDQLNQFWLPRRRLVVKSILAAVLIGFMFLPISEKIKAPGTVLGDKGYQVTSSSSGVISDIFNPYGFVEKGSAIAGIANNDQLLLTRKKIELKDIESRIRSSGGQRSEESGQSLNLERRKIKLEIERISKDINDSQITAPVSGLVEWKPNVLGSFVERGQSVASINPEKQSNVEVRINVSDWINVKVGDQAVFINGRDYSKNSGTVKTIPTQASSNGGVAQYLINIELDTPLDTGTAGTASVTGRKTVLAFWLFRKQIANLKAYFVL